MECQNSRNLLARNRLNLAVWHGYQEVLFSRVVALERASFRYRMGPKGYVVAEWRKTPQGFTGVRLSRNPDYPSLVFRADREGRFLEQRPLTVPQDRYWHRCQLRPGAVEVDGASMEAPELEAGPGLFGLRGSLLSGEVDDLELWEGGRPILVERFRNDANYVRMGLVGLGVVLGGTVGVLALARRERLLWGLLANLAAGLVLLAFFAVDYFFYSSLYAYYEKSESLRVQVAEKLWGRLDPIPAPDLQTVPTFLEVPQGPRPSYTCVQVHQADGLSTVVNDNPQELAAYRRDHPKTAPTVLLLGTSQTWGEGAALLEDSLSYRAAATLPGVELINAGRQGSNSPELAQRYEAYLKDLQADLLVVNLGHNDGKEMLAESLERMAGWGVPLLFVLEANSPENPPGARPFLEDKHRVMREVAARHGLPLVDLHAWMKGQAGTGLLWWDFVHPTSYGHRLAGEFLGQAIKRRLDELSAHQQQDPGGRDGGQRAE